MKFETISGPVDLDPETVAKLVLIERSIWRHVLSGSKLEGWYGATAKGRVIAVSGGYLGPYQDPQQCADEVIRQYAKRRTYEK